VDHLTAENRKTTEQVWKLEVERKALLKQVKDTTLTVQKVSDMVDIPGNVWWKANVAHLSKKDVRNTMGTRGTLE
jgi:predicted secreted protein